MQSPPFLPLAWRIASIACGHRANTAVADIFSKQERSRIMARVRGVNTKPEKVVRSLLHGLGYRFRLHVNELPGKPDIVLVRHRKIIFVHGCFWHGHRRCRRSQRPSSNKRFWNQKLSGNIERDKQHLRKLRRLGWRTLVVWECQTRQLPHLARIVSQFMEREFH